MLNLYVGTVSVLKETGMADKQLKVENWNANKVCLMVLFINNTEQRTVKLKKIEQG